MKKLSFLLGLILIGFATTAQNSCLSLEQLQQLYTNDYEQISIFLSAQGNWSFIYDEPSVNYVLDEDTLEMEMITWKDVTSDPSMEFNLYFRDSTSNIIEFLTDQNCYLTVLSQATNKMQSSKMLPNVRQREYKISSSLSLAFVQADNRGLYLIRFYNPTEWHKLVSEEPMRRQLAQEIFNTKINQVRCYLNMADSSDHSEDYASALAYLDSAKATLPNYDPIALNIPDYKTTIETQSRIITKKNNDKHIISLINQGVEASEQGDLNNARDLFKQALSIDRTNNLASSYLDVVERKIAIMQMRQTKIYDYKTINYEAYRKFTDSLKYALNQLLYQYRDGNLTFNCRIFFDTNARNLSSYNLAHSYDYDNAVSLYHDCDTALQKLMKTSVLLPVAQEGILVNAQTELPIWMNWESQDFKILYRLPKFNIRPKHAMDSIHFDFANFADKNSYIVKGNYTLTCQNIHCLDSLYQQIYISKFHNIGPEAIVYSLLVPGLGTLLATQGTRGGGLMGMFFGFASASASTLYLYYHEKNKIAGLSPEASKYQSSVNKLKRYKWESIGFMTITAGVYLTSAVSAIYRGLNNKKESKTMEEMIHDGPIIISPCDLKIR